MSSCFEKTKLLSRWLRKNSIFEFSNLRNKYDLNNMKSFSFQVYLVKTKNKLVKENYQTKKDKYFRGLTQRFRTESHASTFFLNLFVFHIWCINVINNIRIWRIKLQSEKKKKNKIQFWKFWKNTAKHKKEWKKKKKTNYKKKYHTKKIPENNLIRNRKIATTNINYHSLWHKKW